jgi:hypothetical protein
MRGRGYTCYLAMGSRQAAARGSRRANLLGLERRGLRSPLKSRQIRILPFRSRSPRGFFGLAEGASGFLLLTLLLESLFSITLG